MGGTTARRNRIAAAVALAAAGAMVVAAAPEPREPVAIGRIAVDDRGIGLAAPERAVGIDDTHRTAVPDGEAYRFLGAPGAHVWELADAPWDTTGVAEGEVLADRVRWSLTGVAGPGALAVYDVGADGAPAVRFASADGLPDAWELPAAARGDGTRWAFGAPGAYTLTLAAEAESADGRALRTEQVYTVLVGDEAIARGAAEADGGRPGGGQSDGGQSDGGQSDGGAEPSGEAPPAGTPQADPPRVSGPPASGAPAADGEAADGAAAGTPARKAAVAADGSSASGTSADDAATEKKVLDEGHIDFAARIVDGGMQFHIKDGTTAGTSTWREPSSVVLHVKPAAKKAVPAGGGFDFLGAEGDPVWLLDQVQQDGLLWPGWSTENIAAGATEGGVDFALTAVDGPGAFVLYNYDGLSGADVHFDSGDGVPDSFTVPRNTHAHGGWAFTKEGVYRLTFRMSGKLADGTKVSDTETVAFAVGTADPGAVAPGDGGSGGSGSGGSSGSGADAGGGDSGGAGSADGSAADGSPAGTGGSRDSGSMASTGSGQVLLAGSAAAVLTAAGAAAVLAVRRRRPGRG